MLQVYEMGKLKKMKKGDKSNGKPQFVKQSANGKANKKHKKHPKRISGDWKKNVGVSDSNSTPIGIEEIKEENTPKTDKMLNLAKFEKQIKRKAEKRKFTPEIAEKLQKTEKTKKHKRSKGANCKTDNVPKQNYSRCSREEFLKLWKDYSSKTLTAVENDHCDFKAEFISAANNDDENVNSFLTNNIPEWRSCLESDLKPASPFILFICGAALRCIALNRDLSEFKTEKCMFAKLFAKHMKVKEQASFLAKHAVHAGHGTPQRIKTLIEDDSLKMTNLRWIVVDWSFLDVKKKRLVDFDEIKKDFFDLIKKHLLPLVEINRLRFILI